MRGRIRRIEVVMCIYIGPPFPSLRHLEEAYRVISDEIMAQMYK